MFACLQGRPLRIEFRRRDSGSLVIPHLDNEGCLFPHGHAGMCITVVGETGEDGNARLCTGEESESTEIGTPLEGLACSMPERRVIDRGTHRKGAKDSEAWIGTSRNRDHRSRLERGLPDRIAVDREYIWESQ
ncbi:hypothetical protein KC324_g54 [Hortaea werneckii]|nr:hypothetical protein KC324_g54 [Hortaea werneckii]